MNDPLRFDRSRSALLLIDIQSADFLPEGALPVEEASGFLPAVGGAIPGSRAVGAGAWRAAGKQVGKVGKLRSGTYQVST